MHSARKRCVYPKGGTPPSSSDWGECLVREEGVINPLIKPRGLAAVGARPQLAVERREATTGAKAVNRLNNGFTDVRMIYVRSRLLKGRSCDTLFYIINGWGVKSSTPVFPRSDPSLDSKTTGRGSYSLSGVLPRFF